MKALVLLIAAVAIAVVMVPTSSATVIHATVNTTTNVATINASSDYRLFYTYPNDSEQSQILNGTTIWFNGTASLNSSGRFELQKDMKFANGNFSRGNGSDNQPDNISNLTQPAQQIHVVNATILYQLHIHANSTNLTVFRNLTLNIKITNVTEKVGNKTIVDMSWRAFQVQGELMGTFDGILNFNSHEHKFHESMDINELGDLSMNEGSDLFSLSQVLGDHFAVNRDTINFNVFSVPLNQWTSHYDPSTNTTYLYYNSSNEISYNSTENVNGMNYTLKMIQDPSATLAITGDAQPISANELAIVQTKASTSASNGEYLAIAVVAIVAIALIAALTIKRRK
ncbi:MAG: hypothetical protein QXN66_04300 [Thermoplasmatales archaeon]